MVIVVFILLGLIAGYVARGLFTSVKTSVVFDFGLSIIGAVVAGSLFNSITAKGTAGLDAAPELVAALTGAAASLATFHGLRDARYRRGKPI